MSYERKQILLFGALLVGLTVLFPPWVRDEQFAGVARVYASGYAFIGDPPTGGRLDVARLTFQLLGLTMVFGAWLAVTSSAQPVAQERAQASAPDGQRSEHITRARDS